VIELDRHTNYPKGAACVAFEAKDAYIKAIAAHDVILSFPDGIGERRVKLCQEIILNKQCKH
jgi:hypothetical protein